MDVKKIEAVLQARQLTLEELQEQLPDCSTYEICRYLITNPNVVQAVHYLHDSRIRFTLPQSEKRE